MQEVLTVASIFQLFNSQERLKKKKKKQELNNCLSAEHW